MDHLDFEVNKEDVFFAEVDPKDKYTTIIEQLLPIRDEVADLQDKVDEIYEPELYLELDRVIGRKSYNRRNNLFYTEDNHLIFSAGSIIVGLQIPHLGGILEGEFHKEYFSQSFLEPDSENIFTTNPEISCMAISQDRKFLCIGTTQTHAQLILWELTSRTFMKNMTLNDCCTILLLKYSFDHRMIACVALTRNYTQIVYLIDTHKSTILGAMNLLYSLPFKIKDLESIQNVKQGALQEELLQQSIEDMEDEGFLDKSQLKVTFLAIMIILDEFIITAGDDGFVSF